MVAPQTPYPQSSSPSSGGGTSKIVPVVVSAGLAVGVFAGLLFGLGTGEVAVAGKRSGSATEVISSFDVGTEEYDGSGKVAVAAPDAGVPPADAATPTTADGGVPPADGAVAATDAATATDAGAKPVPAIKLATVTFVVTPPGVTAKITVDGKPVEADAQIDISAGAKNVEIVAKAPGFRDFKKKVSVGKDESVTIDLVKRPVGTPNTGNRNNGGGNSGKIDI